MSRIVFVSLISAALLSSCSSPSNIRPPVSQPAPGVPHPGTEAALRHQIESIEKGQPDLDLMVPSLAQAARAQAERTQAHV